MRERNDAIDAAQPVRTKEQERTAAAVAALNDPAVVAVKKLEQKSGEIETKLSRVEGRIDPLRAMVEQMRNEDFWK